MDLIVRLRNFLLALAAIAVAGSIMLSNQLEFDQRLESFFADDHPDIVILHRSQREFGRDEFVIIAWTTEQLFEHTKEGSPPLSTLVDDRRYLPTLTEAARDSITTLADQLNGIPGVSADQTQHLAKLLERAPKARSVRRAMLRLFEGILVGEDALTTAIVLTLLPEPESSVSRATTLARIRETSQRFNPNSAVAGEPVQIFDMFRLVDEDAHTLFLISLVILGCVLLILFQGIRWTLGSVGLVLGTVVCTRAILVVSGLELSMVASMLNSLVTVIGIATCMHVIVHYRDLRRLQSVGDSRPSDRQSAATRTLRDMAAPVFWTCVTTAVGFGALLVSQITPVRSFAIMISLATAVILVGCVMILPAMMASGRNLRPPGTAPLEHWLDRCLALVCRILERQPRKTGACIFLLTAAAVPGILWLTIQTEFSRNFRQSSSIVQSLRFIERHLGEAGTWEVAFDTPEELSDAFLEDVTELTEQLKVVAEKDGMMRVLSPADVANLPPRVQGPLRMLQRMQGRYPYLMNSMYNDEANRMRIVLRSREQQSAESRARQIADVRSITENFMQRIPSYRNLPLQDSNVAPSNSPDTRPTANLPAAPTGSATQSGGAIPVHSATASGMFVLLTEILRSLLQDQLNSFLVASAGILLCMTVAFRSLRIGLISLFPNVFPVALLLGSLGWAGVPINIGTAMIASVSMGLTVDSTIHYIFAFERARRNHSISEALRLAHAGAGRAVVFAHLALVAGFAVLTASRFIPLAWFGALMSLSMIFGVFGDLVLLPLLLRWTTPPDAAPPAATTADAAA